MEPLSVTIKGFTRITGLGRTKTYELMNAGEIERVRAGGRTLIAYDSVRAYINRSRVIASDVAGDREPNS
jgi:excisionase family DNA binding protein